MSWWRPMLTLQISSWACSTTHTSTRNDAEQIVGSDSHRELALEAARKTITLLKNDGGLLPLDDGRLKRWPSSALTPTVLAGRLQR